MIAVFGAAGQQVTRAQISDWLKKEDDPAFQNCTDKQLAMFLNGLIIDKRGKQEGPLPEPEQHVTNNLVLKKLKIALDLKGEDILEIMGLVRFAISQHEISSFFRKPDNKHYRECKDQILRNFLKGLQVKYRANAPDPES
jgi:uncharacterized protein YehS (DUF1456 family)